MRTIPPPKKPWLRREMLAIRCPRCGREARLEPASYQLDGMEAQAAAADPSLTGVWRGRVFEVVRYPELLPWKEMVRLRRDPRVLGICRCGHCGYLNRHLLEWPREAFYAVSIRGRTLWMRSREHALALRAYVAAEDRNGVPGARFISRVPKEFLAARNRAELVRRLDRLLLDGPEPRAAVPSRPRPGEAAPRR